MRAVARTIVLASRRAARRAWLSSVLPTLSSWLGLNVNTRLVGKLGSWYSIDALHRSQKCLRPTSLIRSLRRRSKLSTANPPTWIARRRTDARTPRPRRETIDSVMAMLGLSCRREVEASLDSPSNELSLPCKQEVQNALSGFSHVRWRRPPYRLSERLRSHAGPRRRRGAAHPRGDRHRETPARHRRVLCRRGPGRRPGALRPAATEGRGRLLEEKEV